MEFHTVELKFDKPFSMNDSEGVNTYTSIIFYHSCGLWLFAFIADRYVNEFCFYSHTNAFSVKRKSFESLSIQTQS